MTDPETPLMFTLAALKAELAAEHERAERAVEVSLREKERADLAEAERDELKKDLAADNRDFMVIALEVLGQATPLPRNWQPTREEIVKRIRELRTTEARYRDFRLRGAWK